MNKASEFIRRDNRITIICEGKSFSFDSITCGREVSIYNNEAKGLLEQIEKSGCSQESVGNFMRFLAERIENVLGVGAVSTIFGAACGYYDLLDLYNHIVNEYHGFTSFKISQYQNKGVV